MSLDFQVLLCALGLEEYGYAVLVSLQCGQKLFSRGPKFFS